jgi:hypothetical protein
LTVPGPASTANSIVSIEGSNCSDVELRNAEEVAKRLVSLQSAYEGYQLYQVVS